MPGKLGPRVKVMPGKLGSRVKVMPGKLGPRVKVTKEQSLSLRRLFLFFNSYFILTMLILISLQVC